ncbi:hypothetical protein H2248_010967 [Termitomyces sp. 'cryptogamus']|nr:hypothetical protein H2248_010967 [Termitomyces sp. 'cryptogamus']
MTEQAFSRIPRSPTVSMNRPAHSPMGPRNRFLRSPSETAPHNPIINGEPTPAYPSSPVRPDNDPLPPIAELVAPPPPTPSSTSPVSPTPTPIFKVIPKPASLVPAPKLLFETEPIKWKALPHEAALWTLDRSELQEIVGRALRRTAPDTFIRLLSLDNLDTDLPVEIDRLKTLKASKQAQYRFLVQRRTMTLQALNSSFISPEKSQPDDDGIPIASKIALELSKVTAECDKIMSDLLVINDQLTQISMLTENHLSSALSVALRKLNKSHSKRTFDLLCAEQRISELQADLEDAWREAERLAREMDQIHAQDGLVPLVLDVEGGDGDGDGDGDDYTEILEQEEAVIKTAEKLKIHSRRASHIPTELIIQSWNTGHMEGLPSFSPLSPMPGVSAMVPPSTIIEAVAESGPLTPPSQDKDDAVSVRSARSARSGKSLRSIRLPEGTRLSLVTAARTRSLRASQNSLRLSRPKTPAHPPMPDLPLELIKAPVSPRSSRALSRQLGKDSESRISLARSRRTSLNDLRPERASTESLAPTVTMDDIYIRLQSQMTHRMDYEIEVVSRTPPPTSRPPVGASPVISDVWLINEKPTSSLPKLSSSERFPSIKRPVQKLKGYTKRYSLPFPLFKRKPLQSSSSARSVSSSKSAPTEFH